MTFKVIIMKSIRGWFPEEPKMSKNLLKNTSFQTSSPLKLTNPLKIIYTLTLGFVVTTFLVFLIVYYWNEVQQYIDSYFLWRMPLIFIINFIPLVVFTGIFLTKGGGLNYFKTWKVDKKLLFSGYSIVMGYIFVMLQTTLDIRSYPVTPFNTPSNYEHPIFYFLYFGLILIAIGFGSLLFLYKKTASSRDETDIQKNERKEEKNNVLGNGKTNKTSKLLIVIGFIFIVVGLTLYFSPIMSSHTEVYDIGIGPGSDYGIAIDQVKGKSVAVNFTVSGGDEKIDFHIEDPFHTTIYAETVINELDFDFIAEFEGRYRFVFINQQSESGKTILLHEQLTVTRGVDITITIVGVSFLILAYLLSRATETTSRNRLRKNMLNFNPKPKLRRIISKEES